MLDSSRNNVDADSTANGVTGGGGGEPMRTGGIKDFIAHTNLIGNVIAAAASQKNTFEPLPFSNYSLFDEIYETKQLKINVNPHGATKCVFLPRAPIGVSVSAERKHGPHIFHPYVYTLTLTHDKYTWDVVRSYKEIKEAHKTLAKIVKADLGRSSACPAGGHKQDLNARPKSKT